jgi:hypothetical protein
MDRYLKAYEVSFEKSADKYEYNKNSGKYYTFRFPIADCDSIVGDLISVDWNKMFDCKKVDECSIHTTHCFMEQVRSKAKQSNKIPWDSKALFILDNISNSAAKKNETK